VVTKHAGVTALVIAKCKGKNNIKMDLKEMACENVRWIHLSQDKYQWWTFAKLFTNLWVQYKKTRNFL